MKKSDAWIIFKKEFKVILRDRRTMFFAFVLPVILYPFLIFGMEKIRTLGEKKLEEKQAIVAVEDKDRFIPAAVKETKTFTLQTDLDAARARSAIEKNEIQGFVRVSEEKEGKRTIQIFYDGSNEFSRHVYQKIDDILGDFKKKIHQEAFKSRGYAENPEDLLKVNEVNLATEKQMGGFYLGKIIPFLLVMLIITGASISAFDLLAGEKERGTLETLLSSAIHRSSIIAGKFMVVFTTAVLSALLNLASLAFYFSLGVFDFPGKGKVAIPIEAIFYALPLLIPLGVLGSAALLLLSGYARSFKEGQLYFLPFSLVCMVLAYVTLLPGVELESIMSLVPIANVALAVKEIFVGKFAWQFLLLVFLSTSFYAYILVRKTIPLLNREDILIPHEAEPSITGVYSYAMARRGYIFYVILWLAMFFVASKLQGYDLVSGLLITEYVLILGASLVFAFRARMPMREAFSFKRPRAKDCLGAVALGISVPMLMPLYLKLQNQFLRFPKSLEDLFEKTFDITQMNVLLAFFLFSLSPAICEELMFRGVLTHSLRSRYSKLWLILVVGLLFGLFHFNIYRLIPTALIGFVLTYLVVRTGSIFPPMVMHMTNNAVALFVLGKLEKLKYHMPWYLSICMALILLLSLRLVSHEAEEKTPDVRIP
jgi:sodium transport system permease protein